MMLRRLFACAFVAFAWLSAAEPAFAVTYTWTGTNSGNWSDAANWGGTGPTSSGSGDLIFPAGALNLAMTNDLTSFTATSMTFSDTAYSVTGNAITLSGVVSTDGGGTLFGIVHVGMAVTLGAPSQLVSTDGRYLSMDGAIGGAFGLTTSNVVVSHPGAVLLAGTNTYTGTTTVSSGYLVLTNGAGLGAGDGTPATGTTVTSGASLQLSGVSVPNEALSIGGNGASGNGALQSMGGSPNSWGGPITLTSDASFVALGSPQPATITGTIAGSFGIGFISQAPGSYTLTGTNSYSGISSIGSGKVYVDGSQPASAFGMGATIFEDAQLGGGGTVGPIFMGSGTSFQKVVAPGDAGTTGILTCLGADLSDVANGNHGVLKVRLNGTAAGAQYDQLAVLGTVNVTGAALSVSLGYTPAVSDTFVIVSNDASDAVTGTFAGLAEGATFVSGGRTFQISYAGGVGGNDITLTVTALTPVELSSFAAE